jgi:hypothetical protein
VLLGLGFGVEGLAQLLRAVVRRTWRGAAGGPQDRDLAAAVAVAGAVLAGLV